MTKVESDIQLIEINTTQYIFVNMSMSITVNVSNEYFCKTCVCTM